MADTHKNMPITFIVPGQLQAATEEGATRSKTGPGGASASSTDGLSG